MTDIAATAATAEQVIKTVMSIEPTALAIASAFVPGASLVNTTVQPWLVQIAPVLEQSLQAVVDGHPGDLATAMQEFVNHIAMGQPNSPILSPPAAG
jgi:hypothetical protein